MGSWQAARLFSAEEPYAVISFVKSNRPYRTAPRIPRPPQFRGRIVIRADDAVPPLSPGSPLQLFTMPQARRIVRFVARMAPRIDVLFVHCREGIGRSAAAAISIAKAYHCQWKHLAQPPYEPNPWIVTLLDAEFANFSRESRVFD